MPKVAGIFKVYINGELQRTKEGVKLTLGGVERTMQVGHKVYGPSEKTLPSQLEFTLAHTNDDDLVALNTLENATVRVETDINKSYLCTGMYTTKPIELTGGEGDAAVEMMGDPAIEE